MNGKSSGWRADVKRVFVVTFERANRPVKTVVNDLRRDPYLKYILLSSLVIFGFWIWYRVPNFATPDEYSRIIDPMKAAGNVAIDPSFESLRRGVTDGRALGATFYFYGLTLVPVFLVILALNDIQSFAELGNLTSRWDLWYAAPAWFWTTSILLGRIANLFLAVGSIYLTYRIGLEIRDRRTGRYASLLLTLSLGMISASHELGEDVPMLFAFLMATYLTLRYVDTGRGKYLFLASGVGGFAIAFKLTGGVIVLIILVAYLLRARAPGLDAREELWRPKLLAGSLIIAVLCIYVGIPSLLLSGPDAIFVRVWTALSRKTASSSNGGSSIWYQLLYQYLRSFGLPLTVAVFIGIMVQLHGVFQGRRPSNGELLVFAGLIGYIVAFSGWSFIHMHHLVPTYPLALLLLGSALARMEEGASTYSRPLIAILILSTAVYAIGGNLQYATEPRDKATEWIDSSVKSGESMIVFENSVADVATTHDKRVVHYNFVEENVTYSESIVVNESAFTEWMVGSPKRNLTYIQVRGGTLTYLNPDSNEAQKYPKRARFIRKLIVGENGYTAVAKFGEMPPERSPLERLVHAGIKPEVEQRADYILIFKRTDQ